MSAPHHDPTLDLPPAPGAGPAPSAAGADPLVGQSIPPYRIVSVLGEGGFGDVYLAEQTAPVRRRVALKVVKPGMDSRQVVARFEQERQALAVMEHPALATIYDAGVTPPHLGSRPFFVMELVRGVPITRYCDQERLGVHQRVRLMIQVCAGVQHAHMKGVLHRDLKPSNILVETVDGAPAPKVIDFGVAKALHGPLADTGLFTEAGQLIGTPEYMAPEQARGSADIDTRADVYALGAILYELLTGVPPFESRTLRGEGGGDWAAMQRTLEGQVPPRPSERVETMLRTGASQGQGPGEGATPAAARPLDPATLSRQLRGDLDWIVMKCLEKERGRRYDSATALAADLERYLNNEPVMAGPPSASYRIQKFVRRHRAGVLAAAGVGAALLLAAAGTSAGMAWAMREQSRAEAEAAAAMAARDEAMAVTDFLTAMLQSVDPEEKEGRRDVTVAQVLDAAAQRLGTNFDDRPQVEAKLRFTIANALRALGRLDESAPHLLRALELRRRDLGPSHVDTLRVLANLASLRYEQGRLTEAQQLTYQAVEGLRAAVGADDPLTLGAMNNLAQLYGRLGRIADAEGVQREVLSAQRRVQGETHPHTLGSMINLAEFCQSLGKRAEAEELLRGALDGFRRAHGPEHPGTLLALSNLAMLQSAMGRQEEAERLQRSALDVRLRVLGESHPDTIGTYANLGLILERQHRSGEAEAMYMRAWELALEHLGETHPTTVSVALGLTTAYESQGWPERSRETTARLLTVIRALGASPTATPNTLNNCAWLLLTVEPVDLRAPTAALGFAELAVSRARENRDPSLWMYLDTLALAQAGTGDHAAAVATQREAIALIPPHGERHRGEMEERLAEYERAAGRE